MVCLGNICRSPLAHGLLRDKSIKFDVDIQVDSAGTSGYHVGEAPDSRMRETAKHFKLNIDDLRARQFVESDFDNFDIIYTMDKSNLSNVLALASNDSERRKVKLILNESNPDQNLEVPDPYYGGEQGFIHVYNMLDIATDKIIEKYSNE